MGGGGGDFGRDKTLAIEYDPYFWTGMYKDVARFLRHCHACQFGKGVSQNTSLYTPLPEPNAPCSLGLFEYGIHVGTPHDSILVMLDCYFRMVHFIPCSKTFDAIHIANLFSKRQWDHSYKTEPSIELSKEWYDGSLVQPLD